MSSREVERRLRQQGADVDALFEISARIEGKVDQLTESTNARFDAQDARFDALDARFAAQDARFDAHDARFDALERSNEQTQVLLTQILERLGRD